MARYESEGHASADPDASGAGAGAGSTRWVAPISRFTQLTFASVGLVAIVVLGIGIGLAVTHSLGSWSQTTIDDPTLRFFAHHHSSGLTRVMSDLTTAGTDRVVIVAALVAGAIWRIGRGTFTGLLALTCAYLGGALIAVVVRLVVHRPGPGTYHVGLGAYAFPSGHAMNATVVYGMIAVLLWRGGSRTPVRRGLAVACCALAALVAFSRIYLRDHWVSDVVAAVILAGGWITVVAFVLRADLTKASPRRESLVQLSARTRRRVEQIVLAVAAGALILAAAYALTPVQDTPPGSASRGSFSCGVPTEVLLGHGPAYRRYRPAGITGICVRDAEQMLVATGACVMVAVALLSGLGVLVIRRARARARPSGPALAP